MQREPLSRDRVLEAAVGLADGGGIAALTMRKLAAELGVEAMSLYHHVANKDEILDGILDAIAAEIDLTEDDNWKATTRRRAVSAKEALLGHPWASMLWVSRLNLGPARMRYMDVALRTFRDGGLDEALTHHAYHVVENHIVGYAMQQVSFAVDMNDLDGLADEFLEQLPADVYPDLALHVRQHIGEPPPGTESEFDFGLRLILDGIERIHHSMSV
ncbi:MAG: TetR/AcrR family transcriptional regulator C-terminal domain-containing protein [Acidimicrobiia bacterium]|nr:TetR/AcrR family transcriptional regulator C-terminal domain-containing protein [Acidimicrobiia bacterium]